MRRRRLLKLGVTGGVASGKSTALAALRAMGWRVFSADLEARRLVDDAEAVRAAIAVMAPEAMRAGRVDRSALRLWVADDPTRLKRLEAALHPPLLQAMDRFFQRCAARGVSACACEIPLLFEAGWDDQFDHIVTIDAPIVLRRARALRRPGVTPVLWRRLNAAQTPMRVKRRLSDGVARSGLGRRALRAALRRALRKRRRRLSLSPHHRRALGESTIGS